MPAPQFTCLLGNGLSVAYNQSLAMDSLTSDMKEQLSEMGGDAAAAALLRFAEALGRDGILSFENLLSPLDDISRALPHLEGAAALLPEGADMLLKAADDLQSVHRVALSIVLELISDRAYGQGEEQFEPVIAHVCRAIDALPTNEKIAVGTLNYDGLVHAGFLDFGASVVDLAPGYEPLVDYEIANGVTAEGRSLRRFPDFGSAQIRILNMHGSLAWLWDPDQRDAVKFEFGALRERRYWEHLRDGTARRIPVVVLTDQKGPVVAEWPFSLAYGAFESHLGWSSHWLVAGYSFADDPLNEVLRSAAEAQRRNGRTPRVLVIDYGPDAGSWRRHVAKVIGVAEENITVDMSGLPNAVDGPFWSTWRDT